MNEGNDLMKKGMKLQDIKEQDIKEQAENRKKLTSLLGDLPQLNRDKVAARLVDTEEFESFTMEKLTLDLNGMEPVPAYFVKPKGVKGKLPVILFNHSHGGNYQNGKDELIHGVSYLKKTSYAEAFAGEGYAVLYNYPQKVCFFSKLFCG